MLMNGGPLAAEYLGVLPVAVMVAWLYGVRAAFASTFGAVAVGALTGWLVHRGVLPAAQPVGAPLMVLVCAAALGLILPATVLPFAMAREALSHSQQTHDALVEAQEKERRAHLAMDALLDQTYELIGLLDPEGRILKANATSLALIGKTEADVLHQHFWDTPWWEEEDRPRVREAIEEAARGERVRFQTKHMDAQGVRHVIDFSLGPYRDAEGRIAYLIPEGRDITELVEAQSRLTQTQKMDAIGQLAGGIAHDFNNLLTGILGSAELLALDTSQDPPTSRRRAMVDTILKAGQRAADLTAQLLAFGRKGTPFMEGLHVNECAEAAVALLERTLGPSIEIVRDFAPEDPIVVGDATGIENAILNLAINARDAMLAGGRLTIRTEVVELDEAFCRASGFEITPGFTVRISVEDTGTGIAPENRARIFEPFFTTKAEGTGLGLPAVFGAVASHKGAIDVHTEQGRGTRFDLYFPSVQTARLTPTLEMLEVGAFDGFRALVADDDPIARATTEAHLRELGFEVLAEEDGAAALERFRADPFAFEVVVLDVIMPKLRGPAVAREAIRVRPDLPVVLMSGYPREEDLSLLSECRGRFLRKPFTRLELVGTLSYLLEPPERAEALGQLS